ncbi:MAG: methionine--tRNA ligase [Candidatus Firestonebacteria bacterium]
MNKKFYVTTAIVYANASPHIGFAYEVIAADVIARYKRLAGYDVFFLTGSDEHSLNVERKAQSLGKTPKEYCDEMISVYKDVWKKLNISNDDFIRTSDEKHKKCAQEIVQRVYEKGDIYKGHYEGWYCTSCEAYLPEKDLVDGNCSIHKQKPSWLKEENFFFALSKYTDKILKHINDNPDFIQPDARKNEVLNVLKEGLTDISISRSTFKWGIPFPLDESQVVYVWFDALLNYISAIGYPDNKEKFNKYWPADIHIIGKDITRFHCLIWPAILMALDLPLPKKIFGHGFLQFKGEKMSKTRGNIVDPVEISSEFGVDTLRYFLMREIPFGVDGDFSIDALIRRINNELANDLGNLVNRITGMLGKYCNFAVPEPNLEKDGLDTELYKKTEEVFAEVDNFMEQFKFADALNKIWELIRMANQYVDKTAPWKLFKANNVNRVNTVMYNSCETLRLISILLSPFMPNTSEKILLQFGFDKNYLNNKLDELKVWGKTQSGIKVLQQEVLFPKIT